MLLQVGLTQTIKTLCW